jgi:hypothetical protein
MAMRNLLLIAAMCAAVPTAVMAEKSWVQVRETKLRSQPKFYATGGATLKYGQAVDQMGASGGWAEVSSNAGRGFLPVTSLSRDQIILSSQDISKVKADTSEVVLAGKGFSKEVESSFKAADAEARFDLVDKIERTARTSPKETSDFAKRGGLLP